MKDNAGIKCDTDAGPCACGAWHGPQQATVIEIKRYDDGGEWVKAPCGGCKELIEDEGPYIADDWWCSQCWLYENRKRPEAAVDRLRAQLADAVKVVEAAREWHRADYGSATEFIADAGLNDAVIECNAKHGAK